MSNLLAKDIPFQFFEGCLEEFTKLKEGLTNGLILHHRIWGEPFELMCDASNHAVGVVLGQRINKKPHVIYYASHTLNNTQMNYTVTKKGFLAVVFPFEMFRPYLIGSYVIVFTIMLHLSLSLIHI